MPALPRTSGLGDEAFVIDELRGSLISVDTLPLSILALVRPDEPHTPRLQWTDLRINSVLASLAPDWVMPGSGFVLEETAMELHLMRHLWGVSDSWEQVFPKFKAAGYVGIDALPPGPDDVDRFRQLLDEYGFAYILQVLTTGDTVEEHVASFREQAEAGHVLEPLLIGCHGGRDAWSEDESAQFFEQVLEIEQALGIPVGHETHRGRILYNPWVTSRILDHFPELKLVCDFSHWTCVAERLLHDQTAIIRQCAERCIHVHARVGYAEGPQVPDPRASEYSSCLEAFEHWWDLIWDAQEARGVETSTLTPEYGPPGYLHTLPYTRQPVVDLEEICDWQAQRAAECFAHRP